MKPWEHADSFLYQLDRVAEIMNQIRSPRHMFTLASESLHDDTDRLLIEAEAALKDARASLAAHGKARQSQPSEAA